METPAKKLKEGPDVSPQKENGTPTKAKRARKCISLQRRKKQLFPKSRLKTVVQPETLLSMSKVYTLSSALKNTELTMKNFLLGWSGEIQEQQLLVKTLVLSISYHQLIILISLDGFLSETRHTDGSLYPSKTVYQLLCGLLLYMKSQNPAAPNFLD